MGNYKKLIVWEKSMNLVKEIYFLTKKLPKEETFGLISQMNRRAVSIPSNIAEGSRRGSDKSARNFYLISYGSGAELETQLEIIKMLSLIRDDDCTSAEDLLDEIMKMLNKMVNKVE